MNRVRDKLILITGASSGIGAACARRFAADGANLVLWARRRERLAELGAELERGHGVAARLAQVDVRDREAVNRATAAGVTRRSVASAFCAWPPLISTAFAPRPSSACACARISSSFCASGVAVSWVRLYSLV